MRNINEYKRRFNTLLESTMGNVKPLISEAPEFEEFVVPTLDMVKRFDAWSEPIPTDGSFRSPNAVELKHELSLSGNEYKITLPEGMYDAGEEIKVYFSNIYPLKLTNEGVNKNIDNVNLRHPDDPEGPTVTLRFKIPNTQKELEENSPFIKYVEFRCKNVKGGKIRFSVEVPSGSEIFEKPKDVNERDLSRIVRRVIKEQSNDVEAVVLECVMENTTLKDLQTIPADCVTLLSGDMTKMFACMSKMDSNTFNTIKSKIVPITKCVTTKMGGGSSFPGIEF